jgi:predicted nucleic acid-binding protein
VRVVFDANVIASGVCWRGESYLCLVKLARRQVFAFGALETLAETNTVVTELIRRKQPPHGGSNLLNWYLERVKVVDPAALGKKRSRDLTDDAYLSAALSAKAHGIVTYERGLLVLGKPFGIPIITPAQFLKNLKG